MSRDRWGRPGHRLDEAFRLTVGAGGVGSREDLPDWVRLAIRAALQEAWIAVIPEPGTALLVLTGFVGLAFRHRHA